MSRVAALLTATVLVAPNGLEVRAPAATYDPVEQRYAVAYDSRDGSGGRAVICLADGTVPLGETRRAA